MSRVPQHARARTTRAIGRHARSQSPAGRRLRVAAITGLSVVVVSTVWFGVRAVLVKNHLESAQAMVTELQEQGTSLDLDSLSTKVEEIRVEAAGAASGTHDPTWRLAEFIPVLGPNLSAVRAVAETIDDLVSEVASPAINIAASFDLGAKDPDTGGFNLEPLDELKVIFGTADTVAADSLAKLDQVDTSQLVSPVSSAVIQIDDVLTRFSPTIQSVSPMLDVVSAALGQDGPRNYLLAFQNNAESNALGGSAAAYTMMHTDQGAVTLATQANSGDFIEGTPVQVDIDQSALDIYGSFLVDHINTSTSRPDFPTAASIMSAFWLRDQGDTIDGVLSIDPLALALMLNATGDITLSTGDVLTADNAVSLLTNEIYMRYPLYDDAPMADAFFEEAASTIVGRIMGGEFDIAQMVTAASTAVEQGSIMFWSADSAEQQAFDGLKVQGILPKSNDDKTVIGVYYRDTSASKIDYYLNTAVTAASDVCSSPANPTFTTSVTLQSNLTLEQANALPDYVKSGPWGGSKFRTEIFVYGPAGGSVVESSVTSMGLETVATGSSEDLGRPVATYFAYLAPGESTTVQATFTGAPGTYGPLVVQGTPMINPTVVTIDPAAVCG